MLHTALSIIVNREEIKRRINKYFISLELLLQFNSTKPPLLSSQIQVFNAHVIQDPLFLGRVWNGCRENTQRMGWAYPWKALAHSKSEHNFFIIIRSWFTFCEIDTFRTCHKKCKIPIKRPIPKPAAKTIKMPTTLPMSNSGVSTLISFSFVQLTGSPSAPIRILFVIHHFSFKCCTVRSSLSSRIASFISSRYGESVKIFLSNRLFTHIFRSEKHQKLYKIWSYSLACQSHRPSNLTILQHASDCIPSEWCTQLLKIPWNKRTHDYSV